MNHLICENITLIVPTLNRFIHIKAYLEYLQKNKFAGTFLLADSSNPDIYEKTSTLIKNYKFNFIITQINCKNLKNFEAIKKVSDFVQTKFCMFIPDDDFLILETLEKCKNFLENNNDYSVAGGINFLAILDDKEKKVSFVNRYNVNPIEHENLKDRIGYCLKNYTVINYSLSRTHQWKKRWPEYNIDNPIGAEIIPACLIAAQGKVKMLNEIFCVREIHNNRYLFSNIFDRILDLNWSKTIKTLIESVYEEIDNNENINKSEIENIIKSGLKIKLSKEAIKFSKLKKNIDIIQAIKNKIINIKNYFISDEAIYNNNIVIKRDRIIKSNYKKFIIINRILLDFEKKYK
jgi:glycosyltransferase domain-containing protein